MSAPNLMTLTKRTSLNVYGADIFTCSRQPQRHSLKEADWVAFLL